MQNDIKFIGKRIHHSKAPHFSLHVSNINTFLNTMIKWMYIVSVYMLDLICTHLFFLRSIKLFTSVFTWGCCGCDHMVVGFTTTYTINAYHHWCEFESGSGHTTLCDKVCQCPPIKLTTRYNWNIVERGVKHKQTKSIFTFFRETFKQCREVKERWETD